MLNKLVEYFKRRIVWGIAAVVLLVVELVLLLGPLRWGGVEQTNWLTGEGAWSVVMQEGIPLTQEFVPEYDYLESLSLLFQKDDLDLTGSSVEVWLEEPDGSVVFSAQIPYNRMSFGRYTDIDAGVTLDPDQKYYLKIECHPGESGQLAMVSVCGTQFYMPENKRLYQIDDIPDNHLVSRYVYQRAITDENRIRIIGLSVLSALALFVGIPKNKWIRRGIAAAAFLFTPLVLGRQLEFISLVIEEGVYIPGAMKWNVAIMYLLEGIVLLCSQSLRFSVIFTNLALTIVYSADYFVRNYRSTPLKWSDFAAAGTAAQVVGEYDLTPSGRMAICWLLFILICIVVLQAKVEKNKEKGFYELELWKKLCLRGGCLAAGIATLCCSGYVLLATDFLEDHGFVVFHGFAQSRMYQINGYLVSSCLDYKTSRIVEPEGYSETAVSALFEEYESAGDETAKTEDMPHVIMIMNESFSDLRVLGNLEISEEIMPFFKSLEEDTVRGTLNVSVIGGGTSNTEFEVFTGCSMGLFPGAYYPYLQCISQPVDSLVGDLKAKGYSTFAMHPELAANWNRNVIYPYLGFEECYWIEDFKGAEVLHSGVSDKATYQKVQELFENRQEGEKLFVFDLTMQNHGGYAGDSGFDGVYSDTAAFTNIHGVNVNSPELDVYLSLMKKSDEALEELISYFSEQDENVIICFFGDHQPKFNDDSLYDKIYQQTEGLSEVDKVMNKYVTPFMIWANYDIEEAKDINISSNYLSVVLQKTAGMEMSPHFEYLSSLMEQYPIITSNGYVDSQGTFYEWSGDSNEFSDYRILQYYRLFGK